MTPAQHLHIAEQLLEPAGLDASNGYLTFNSERVQAAIAHALIALAAEAGTPHPTQPSGGGGNEPGTA